MGDRSKGKVHSFRVVYAAQLVQLVARWGITPAQLLDGIGLAEGDLAALDAPIDNATMKALVERAIRLTGEPGLGFYYGLHLKLSAHGIVGLAAMTAATLGEALVVAERFFQLRASHLRLTQSVEGDQAIIELTEAAPLGERNSFLIEALFTAMTQMAKMLIGSVPLGVGEVVFPEPAYFQGFAHLFPGPVRFRQPANRILFPARLLAAPLQMADAVASRQAVEQCERELATLAETSSLLASVRGQMIAREAGFPSLTELADQRRVSPRTLKRQLEAYGTSFQRLLDELRRDRALTLLEDPALTVDLVAERLGYSDPSNFNRAFRRWMGVAPSAWRAAHTPAEGADP